MTAHLHHEFKLLRGQNVHLETKKISEHPKATNFPEGFETNNLSRDTIAISPGKRLYRDCLISQIISLKEHYSQRMMSFLKQQTKQWLRCKKGELKIET